ncbi:hypothetical protein [Lysinibacillus fusiformis]
MVETINRFCHGFFFEAVDFRFGGRFPGGEPFLRARHVPHHRLRSLLGLICPKERFVLHELHC